MKILFYTTYFTSHTGGVEKFLCELVTWLQERGHECAVICEDPEGQPLFEYPNNSPIFRCKLRSKDRDDLMQFRNLVESYQPDLFVFCSFSHTLARRAWTWLTGLDIHFIISEHGPPSKIYEYHSRFLREVNAACADGIHVLLPEFGRDLRFISSEKLIDIQHVIKPPSFHAKPDIDVNGRFRIMNVGRLDLVQKRQDLLIEAFALIAPEFPNWDLAIAGSMWNIKEKQKIDHLVAHLQLSKRVQLLGPIGNVEEELSRSHIFGFPSSYEGLPLALQEALAVGLPAVGMAACEGTNHLIRPGYNGVLVNEHSEVWGLADALRHLMRDPDTRRIYGQNARTVIENKTPDKIFGKWEVFLRNIMSRPAALFVRPTKENALRALAGSSEAIDTIIGAGPTLNSLKFQR